MTPRQRNEELRAERIRQMHQQEADRRHERLQQMYRNAEQRYFRLTQQWQHDADRRHERLQRAYDEDERRHSYRMSRIY